MLDDTEVVKSNAGFNIKSSLGKGRDESNFMAESWNKSEFSHNG